MGRMQLTSAEIQEGAEIPSKYTSDGENASPELSWKDAPPTTKSFVLVLHDPDAPREGGFTHWVVFNIRPGVGHIEEAVPEGEEIKGVGLQAKNEGGNLGYLGPAPPSGVHRYFFKLYALDCMLDVTSGADFRDVQAALRGHVLSQAELMGTYEKKKEQAA
jgi:Raf kinase inhibitor-like YbhB/YbcL family protein